MVKFIFLKIYLFIVCMCVFACMYVYVPRACHRGQKSVSVPPELQLEKVMNRPVDTGTECVVFCESNTALNKNHQPSSSSVFYKQ